MTLEEKINLLKEAGDFYANYGYSYTTAKSIAIYSVLKFLANLSEEDGEEYCKGFADGVVACVLNQYEGEFVGKDKAFFEGGCGFVVGVFEGDEDIIEGYYDLVNDK